MAILAAVLIPTVTNKIKDANASAAKSDASTLANAIQSDIMSATSGFGELTYIVKGTGDLEIEGETYALTAAATDNGAEITGNAVVVKKEGGGKEYIYTVSSTGTVTLTQDGEAPANP